MRYLIYIIAQRSHIVHLIETRYIMDRINSEFIVNDATVQTTILRLARDTSMHGLFTRCRRMAVHISHHLAQKQRCLYAVDSLPRSGGPTFQMSRKMSGKSRNNVFLRDLNSLKIIGISFLFFRSFLAPYRYRKLFELYRILVNIQKSKKKKRNFSNIKFNLKFILRLFPFLSKQLHDGLIKHKLRQR